MPSRTVHSRATKPPTGRGRQVLPELLLSFFLGGGRKKGDGVFTAVGQVVAMPDSLATLSLRPSLTHWHHRPQGQPSKPHFKEAIRSSASRPGVRGDHLTGKFAGGSGSSPAVYRMHASWRDPHESPVHHKRCTFAFISSVFLCSQPLPSIYSQPTI